MCDAPKALFFKCSADHSVSMGARRGAGRRDLGAAAARSAEGRRALLDAAFEELLEHGPALPAEAVARRAGASKALVFHHFGTREGLLDAMAARVLEETQEGLAALAAEHPDPRDRLPALARALLAVPPDPPPATRRVLLFWLADDGRGGARGALRDALVSDFVAATLQEARARADPREVAALLLARWHGATHVYANGGALDFEHEADALVEALGRIVSP